MLAQTPSAPFVLQENSTAHPIQYPHHTQTSSSIVSQPISMVQSILRHSLSAHNTGCRLSTKHPDTSMSSFYAINTKRSRHSKCSRRKLKRRRANVLSIIRDTPEQNGAAERVNRRISEGATALLNEAKLPPSFWGLAVRAYVYVSNRWSSQARKGATAYERFISRKTNVEHSSPTHANVSLSAIPQIVAAGCSGTHNPKRSSTATALFLTNESSRGQRDKQT